MRLPQNNHVGGPAQAPAGLSSQATEPAHGLGPAGFNLPSPCSACRNIIIVRAARERKINVRLFRKIRWQKTATEFFGPGQRRGFKSSPPCFGGAAQASRRASLQGALRARFARPFARSLRAAASVAPLVCHSVLQRRETPPKPGGFLLSAKAPPPPGGAVVVKQKQSEVRQGASCAGRLKAKANIEEKEMYGHPAAVETMAEIFGEPISVYTRRQALDDGFLVDVSETAREAGFRFPVAMTRAAWEDCVSWSEEDNKRQTYQDEAGRLWDVLWMASVAARRNSGSELRYQLYRVPRGGRGVRPRLVVLQMHCGPGDEGEAVITISMLGED
jgi:hypothetical protein